MGHDSRTKRRRMRYLAAGYAFHSIPSSLRFGSQIVILAIRISIKRESGSPIWRSNCRIWKRVSEAEKLFKKLIKKELPFDEIRKLLVEESIGALTAFPTSSIELRSRCREVIMGDVTSCIQSLQPIQSDVV
ncbi:hypothetical protein L1887_31923 [Cichorium endivia]|nr:hypothetical protein L1887_31923 [Cichorium endivia]